MIVMAEDYLKRNDPVQKAERASIRAEAKLAKSSAAGLSQDHVKKNSAQGLSSTPGMDVKVSRVTLATNIRNAILLREDAKCSFVDLVSGKKCDSRHQLEVDHIIPRSLGGSNDPDNLRLLCRTHNRLVADRAFGERFMAFKTGERSALDNATNRS